MKETLQDFYAGGLPKSVFRNVTTNGGSAAVSVAVSTQSGWKWLSATPIHGDAPATLIVTVDPQLFQPLAGVYYDSGTVTITGPRNTQTIAVQFNYVPPIVLTADPSSVQFFAQAGQPAPPTQTLFVNGLPQSAR